MQKTKIENEHKECSASKTPSNVAHQKSTVSNGQDCGDKVAKQIFQGKQEQEATQVCHASTPTQKISGVSAPGALPANIHCFIITLLLYRKLLI